MISQALFRPVLQQFGKKIRVPSGDHFGAVARTLRVRHEGHCRAVHVITKTW
jgi:hypothetical protein